MTEPRDEWECPNCGATTRTEVDGLRRLLEVAHADVAAAVAERDELRERVDALLRARIEALRDGDGPSW